MAVPEGYFVSVGARRPVKVFTMKGFQHHSGMPAVIRVPGVRQPVICPHPHKKTKAARACGEAYARKHARQEKEKTNA